MTGASRAFLLFALLALPIPGLAADAAGQWWADVSALADDGMEGRLTGSPGYDRAAQYVIGRLQAEGLKPAGAKGYLQPVAFEQQIVDQAAGHAELTGADGTATPLQIGNDMLITAGGSSRPSHVEAPLVFIGYGLHLPGQG
jgi:hypothetical protein